MPCGHCGRDGIFTAFIGTKYIEKTYTNMTAAGKQRFKFRINIFNKITLKRIAR